ncbi:MAG: TniQ family protein [Myxacorys californica WJT36-NPBG1]|jgi:hypothetical protein|nr:TniQ family protein [Myxacorys californica WJT36-NPBG1]
MQFEAHQIELERVEPFPGESISHFLGRFERANVWTTYQIGRVTGIKAGVSRWKKLYLSPLFPTRQELEVLAEIVEVNADRLAEMLPPPTQAMKPPKSICLCAACYAKTPCHLIKWQYKEVTACDLHGLYLLKKCPKCKTPFDTPADWDSESCTKSSCCASFAEMVVYQGKAKKS